MSLCTNKKRSKGESELAALSLNLSDLCYQIWLVYSVSTIKFCSFSRNYAIGDDDSVVAA